MSLLTSAATRQRTGDSPVFAASSGGVAFSLTWQNIRVRPAAASPLASGDITKTGTSVMAAVVASTSFGQLIEVGPMASTSLPAELGLNAVVLAQPVRLTGIEALSDGIRITFKGDAGATYELQRSVDLRGSGTAWEAVGLVTTDENGRAKLTDANAPAGQGFYRTVARCAEADSAALPEESSRPGPARTGHLATPNSRVAISSRTT